MKKIILVLVIALVLSLTVSVVVFGAEKWASGVKILFFVGGDPGDTFSTIVYNGALQAAADTGADVEYIFSGWSVEKMISQLREGIATRPDGIAFMGHAGDDAVMPLAKEASEAGIIMMYQNVDVPLVRAVCGGGYVGSNLAVQGRALGEEAIRLYGLKSGDYAIVYGAWGEPGRYIREEATALALEEAGIIVERIKSLPAWAADPTLALPTYSAAVLAHPEVKAICYSGGQALGAAGLYMEAVGRKPGEIINFGYDLSPQVTLNFKEGWVQLTSDQQPFLQGYIPILSICLTAKYKLAPLNVDTSKGFVDVTTYAAVADLVLQGKR
jgi:simple sugar transport system substrate-binding protein